MATWNSRGLRGSTLEEFINHSNERYSEMGLALMQKIPTPITPVRMDKDHRQITLAYFDKASTVDYIGAVQGIPVCFDAKECKSDNFSLQNIHEHQFRFMTDFEKQMAFIMELDKIKKITRQTYLSDGSRKENDAEHSWHLALMAFVFADYANEKIDSYRPIRSVAYR